jgi:hypothetical protein
VQADPIPARAETNSTGPPPLVCCPNGHSELREAYVTRPSEELLVGMRFEEIAMQNGFADAKIPPKHKRVCQHLSKAGRARNSDLSSIFGLNLRLPE